MYGITEEYAQVNQYNVYYSTRLLETYIMIYDASER